MRSEVVKCIRSSEATVTVAMGSRVMANVISNIVGDMLKKDQVAMLRISVEIVEEEREEEKVGSKVTIRRHEGGARGACMNAAGGWEYLLEAITKDWQPGESRKVKSILFETPSGVPVVEFVETPRERLDKTLEEASKDAACGNHAAAYAKSSAAMHVSQSR